MRELAHDAIRSATLTRRFRGYDRQETEGLLARVAESYEKVEAEGVRLSEKVASLRAEAQEREARSRAELDRLNNQLGDRERQITDLETKIARLEREQSKQLEDLARMRAELSQAQTVHEDLEAESREHGERVARSALREKALVAQIAMLVSQLKEEEPTQALPPDQRALPERADRGAAMLHRLDRVVETLERESRREAEITLKKARERADEIVHSAERRRRRLEADATNPGNGEGAAEEEEEYDPIAAHARIEPAVTEPEVSEALGRDVGEASWTSPASFEQTPDRWR
jgi:cell division septum initiation protein DivIVA